MTLPRRAAAAAVAVAVAVMAALPSLGASKGAPAAAPSYKNHTVGGADGWFFNPTTNTTSAKYSAWAAKESFFLGDYLIFKTNANSSVVHTPNATTYSLCDASNDDGPKTFIYGGGGGGGGGMEETDTVVVPLTFEGANYFFSDADDGVQCEQGMRFEIKVGHGNGLPPALAHPPPSPKPRVLAPPPDGSSAGIASPDVVGQVGWSTTRKNGGSRISGVRSAFLGVGIGVGLAVLVAV